MLTSHSTVPMREVVNTLLRRDLGLVDEAMGPYFQDVYDHVPRATEWTESLRDLVSTILETNLTIQGNRMNSIMKKVTSWAAIIAVPTAVTGWYGMNVPYPGFGQHAGFVTSMVLLVVLSGGLHVLAAVALRLLTCPRSCRSPPSPSVPGDRVPLDHVLLRVQALLVPFGGAARWHGKFYPRPAENHPPRQGDITSPRRGSAAGLNV